MEEKLQRLAALIDNVDMITDDLKKIIDSPLVSTGSSAYAFLFTAWSASDHAHDHLRYLYDEMKLNVQNEGN